MSNNNPSHPSLADAFLAWLFIERGGNDSPNGAIRLWRWIIQNRKAEGVSVPIRALAAELGISASSVLRARKFLVHAGLIDGDSENLYKVDEEGNEIFDPYQKHWAYPGENTKQLGKLGILQSSNRNFKISDEVISLLSDFLADLEAKQVEEQQAEPPAVIGINVLKAEHQQQRSEEDAAQTTLEELIAAAEEREAEEEKHPPVTKMSTVPAKEEKEVSEAKEPSTVTVDRADKYWLDYVKGLGITKKQIEAIELLASRKRLTKQERVVAEERRLVVVAECMRRKKSVYLMSQICLCSETTIRKIVKKIKEA